MDLITEFSPWWIIPCVLLGGLYAYVLYRKDRIIDELPSYVKYGMALLRFLLICFLALLLLNPIMRNRKKELVKPFVIIGQDNSESLVRTKDSIYYRRQFPSMMKTLVEKLQADFNVKTYSFGSAVTSGMHLDYSENESNISDFLEKINQLYENRNVGAIILSTDGIYNAGANPVYIATLPEAPLFTIALGDTAVNRDLMISRVLHNKVAYLGDKFPLEVVIDAKKLKGQTATLTISEHGKTLYQEPFVIDRNDFTTKMPVILEAEQAGVRKYTLSVSPVEGEATLENNMRDIFIDILSDKIRILILSSVPHPDIAAMKHAITSHENYDVQAQLAADFHQPVKGYHLIILHQLPSVGAPFQKILRDIESAHLPVFYILGKHSDLSRLGSMHAGVQIQPGNRKFNEVQPVFNKDFTFFSLSGETVRTLSGFPPLEAPFGEYRLNHGAEVLLKQKIGVVHTDEPLLFFHSGGLSKKAMITGSGIWKWRLYDFEQNGNHNAFNELISKTIQYLTMKEDKSRFRVYFKHRYEENERLLFDAELYDMTFAPLNEPEVQMQLTDEHGNSYDFVFGRTAKAYHLDAGFLKPGIYTFRAVCRFGDKVYEKKGEFSVNELAKESLTTTADHQLLYKLSAKHNGRMLYPDQLDSIPVILQALDDVKPVSFYREKLRALIHLKWLFFIFLLLLSAEWFWRKRNGSY